MHLACVLLEWKTSGQWARESGQVITGSFVLTWVGEIRRVLYPQFYPYFHVTRRFRKSRDRISPVPAKAEVRWEARGLEVFVTQLAVGGERGGEGGKRWMY